MFLITIISSVLFAQTSLVNFAVSEWQNDSQVRIEDAYKWLYQATRGGEHAAPNEREARAWLAEEWKTLDAPQANEPLWESLRPDGKIGRLNLRPFRAAGGRQEEIVKAFVESAQKFRSEPRDFIEAWQELGKRLDAHSFGNLTEAEWRRLDDAMRAKNYPAIHHSADYEQARYPAYRILTSEVAQKLFVKLQTAK